MTNSSDRTPVPSGSGVHRRSILSAALATLPLGVLPTASPARAAGSSAGNGRKWTASWATAIQGAFVAPTAPQGPAVSAYIPQPDLSFALPNATTEGARDQTMRMIVKPDLWGETVRVRFSNLFGTRPVTFGAASVALQAYQANLAQGTSVPLTFGGRAGVTIEPGERRFSDPVRLPFVTERTLPLLAGRRLAVSFAVQGSSGPASFHLSALATNYISPPGSGDATGAEDDVAFPYTTTSFFFIDALDVTAPAGTLVVCALGDSITDGTFSTINGYDRWSDVMSRQLHNCVFRSCRPPVPERCRPLIPNSCRPAVPNDVGRGGARPRAGGCLHRVGGPGQASAALGARFRRRLSPRSWMRWALWTRRSRMASARVGLPAMRSCQRSGGTWLVISEAPRP